MKNSDVLDNLDNKLAHLSDDEGVVLTGVIRDYLCLFSDDPGRTDLVCHDVLCR